MALIARRRMVDTIIRPELAPGTIGLRVDGESIRIQGSRITLDLIVEEYERGTTPEEMVLAYDTLSLHDVNLAVKYYLQHKDEVQAYLKLRKEKADAMQALIESKQPLFKPETLLAMKQLREKLHASRGQ